MPGPSSQVQVQVECFASEQVDASADSWKLLPTASDRLLFDCQTAIISRHCLRVLLLFWMILDGNSMQFLHTVNLRSNTFQHISAILSPAEIQLPSWELKARGVVFSGFDWTDEESLKA